MAGSAPTTEASAEDSFSPVEKLDNLSGKQKRQVENQSRPNALLIHETIRAEGESELTRTVGALLLSGFAAGLSMGFSMIVQGKLGSMLPKGPVNDVVAPLGYTVGFLIVVLGRQQLFTENTLTPILPMLHNRDRATVWKVCRLWALVLASNIAGAWLLAAVLASAPVFAPSVMAEFTELGRHTLEASFGLTFLRAIFTGWLIALMVWLLPAADSSRVAVIVVITYVIALLGFTHVVAGSIDCAFLVMTSQASLSDFCLGFFLPTLLGNVVGGVALVAVLNAGQVAPEVEEHS